MDRIMEKERQLEALAQQDEIYNLWKEAWEFCGPAFMAFANAQPEDVKNFLWGYADAGPMMQQRKVNLACEYMEFEKN